ncbi:MAG: hypothetical protein QOF40_188, partial [Actinomycetota bacterium]|nr:hypothetical protein [Actinomycetota bacterium]
MPVSAVVLTFESPASLGRCLDAIRSQTTPPSSILIVDNGNTEVDLLPGERLLRLSENLGPAGGYAAGLASFLESGSAWAWVMDDDCAPEPDALAAQLAEADESRVVLGTMIDRDTGAVTNTQGWCGVLIPRPVIASVGVPD